MIDRRLSRCNHVKGFNGYRKLVQPTETSTGRAWSGCLPDVRD